MRISKRVAAGLVVSATTLLAVAAHAETYVPVQTQEVRGYAMVQGVNARTGNFSLTYEAYPRQGFAYRRTYNSNGPIRGTFGLGWGSTFDTRAVGLADGRVAVLENGNGAITFYGTPPQNETAEQRERAVAAAMFHPNDIFENGVNQQLAPSNAQEEAVKCGQALLATALDGYARYTCAGRIELFHEGGRLSEVQMDGELHYELHVVRDDEGQIERLYDNIGHKLTFARTPARLTVTDDLGETTIYDFDALGRNIKVSGSQTPTYTFGYSPAGLMDQIAFIDGTARKIDYDALGRAVKVTERNGDTTEFQYQTPTSTLVVRRPAGGQPMGLLLKFTD